MIHTVVISYNRLELTKQALTSYLDTVSLPWSLTVVDNGSDDETTGWLRQHAEFHGHGLILLGKNNYPGYACNRGFELAPEHTVLLHRADNDFVFLPGWCEEVCARFDEDITLGQLGLRTGEEELHNFHNVGGNCVFRRALWDEGLRWDERPWPKIKTPGYTEDSFMSPQVTRMGWRWTRVLRPCIHPISSEDPDDPYYQKGWADRGIFPIPEQGEQS